MIRDFFKEDRLKRRSRFSASQAQVGHKKLKKRIKVSNFFFSFNLFNSDQTNFLA